MAGKTGEDIPWAPLAAAGVVLTGGALVISPLARRRAGLSGK